MNKYIVIFFTLIMVLSSIFSISFSMQFIPDKSKNIEVTNKIFIRHLGASSSKIYPVLIRLIENDNTNESAKYVFDNEEFKEDQGQGTIILLKSVEFEKVLKVLNKRAKKAIENTKWGEYGTFKFVYYNDNVISNVITFNIDTSREIFKDLYELFKNRENIGIDFREIANRIRPLGTPYTEKGESFNW